MPVGRYKDLKLKVAIKPNLEAPIKRGEAEGTLNVMLDNKVLMSPSLVALNDNLRGGFFSVLWDRIMRLF